MQYNLFEVYAGKKDDSSDSKDSCSKRYFVNRDIEESYSKQAAGGSKSDLADSLKPRFYNLAAADYSTQVCIDFMRLLRVFNICEQSSKCSNDFDSNIMLSFT